MSLGGPTSTRTRWNTKVARPLPPTTPLSTVYIYRSEPFLQSRLTIWEAAGGGKCTKFWTDKEFADHALTATYPFDMPRRHPRVNVPHCSGRKRGRTPEIRAPSRAMEGREGAPRTTPSDARHCGGLRDHIAGNLKLRSSRDREDVRRTLLSHEEISHGWLTASLTENELSRDLEIGWIVSRRHGVVQAENTLAESFIIRFFTISKKVAFRRPSCWIRAVWVVKDVEVALPSGRML